MDRLTPLFDQFLQQRTCITNVTPKTREWYQSAWKAFTVAQAVAPPGAESAPLIAKADLQQFVVHLHERCLRPRRHDRRHRMPD
jgi:hypothetical protein